ncbi:MAG TPA: hypothetical protein VFK30_04895 [Anaerolineae bacterium]|nr:hypothetical protein [Anaerolineae bacterium]
MSIEESPRSNSARPAEQGRCALCPSDQICIWQCEHSRRMLKILMGETLMKPQREAKTDEGAAVNPDLLELYN